MSDAQFIVEADAEGAFEYVTRFYQLDRNSNQKGIVLRRDGDVIGAALYVEFNGSNVCVHIAGSPGRKWLTRDLLYWCFHYPFVQLGCRRMTCWVNSDNEASNRFCEKTGWTREAVLAQAGSEGQDVNIYRMFREDCKYV